MGLSAPLNESSKHSAVGGAAAYEFGRELRIWRGQLWAERAARAVLFGITGAIVATVAAELGTRWTDAAPALQPLLAWLPLLGAGLVFTWVAIHPPSLDEAAREADRRFALREQVATALELVSTLPLTGIEHAQVASAHRASARARRTSGSAAHFVRHISVLATALLVCVALSVGLDRADPLLARMRPPVDGWPTGHLPWEGRDNESTVEESAAIEQGSPGRLGGLLHSLREAPGDQLTREHTAEAEQQLAAETAAARDTQQSLNRLASALTQVAAGRDAAEALGQGNYASAAKRLSQLGRNADQLSDAGRQALGAALLAASRQNDTQAGLPEAERQAGQALTGSSYPAMESAMNNLAESVQRTGESALSPQDLRAAWQEVAEARSQAEGGASSVSPDTADLSRLAPQASASADARSSVAGATDRAVPGGSGTGQPAGGSTADSSANHLETAGRLVEVPVVPSTGASTTLERPEPRASVAETATIGSVAGASPQSPTEGVVAPAESNDIALDRRAIVRVYFGSEEPTP